MWISNHRDRVTSVAKIGNLAGDQKRRAVSSAMGRTPPDSTGRRWTAPDNAGQTTDEPEGR
jgi:hypothetical protein